MGFFKKNNDGNESETYIMDSSIYQYTPAKKKEIIQISIISLMVVLLIVGVFVLMSKSIRSKNNVEIMQQTAVPTSTPDINADNADNAMYSESETTTEDYTVLDKFTKYLTTYPDLVGWLKIEGTNVDYPVVQSKNINDPHCYMDLAPDRTPAVEGSIFLDTRNYIHELDSHTVIYGHNMNDGSMFGNLDKYKNRYYRKNNSIINFDTLYHEYQWELINVFITNTEFYYIQTYFETDEEFVKLMQECISRSIYANDTVISPDDKILTLSTCTNDIHDGRFVVQARLIVDEDDVNKN